MWAQERKTLPYKKFLHVPACAKTQNIEQDKNQHKEIHNYPNVG